MELLTREQTVTRFWVWFLIGIALEQFQVPVILHEVGHVLVAQHYGKGGIITSWDHARWWGYVPNEDIWPWMWYVGILTLIGVVLGFMGHVGGPLRSHFCGPWFGMAASGWWKAWHSWDWEYVWANQEKLYGHPPTPEQIAAHREDLWDDWLNFTAVILCVIVAVLWVWWRAKPYAQKKDA